MILSITGTPFFNQHPLGTKFRKKHTTYTYTLRRYTSERLQGTLFLICDNTDQIIEVTDQDEWELDEPEPEDPQALLTRLLECFHDGDRKELLSALTDITTHIRKMHKLPVISRDTVTDTTIYIVPTNEEINTNTGTTNIQVEDPYSEV